MWPKHLKPSTEVFEAVTSKKYWMNIYLIQYILDLLGLFWKLITTPFTYTLKSARISIEHISKSKIGCWNLTTVNTIYYSISIQLKENWFQLINLKHFNKVLWIMFSSMFQWLPIALQNFKFRTSILFHFRCVFRLLLCFSLTSLTHFTKCSCLSQTILNSPILASVTTYNWNDKSLICVHFTISLNQLIQS